MFGHSSGREGGEGGRVGGEGGGQGGVGAAGGVSQVPVEVWQARQAAHSGLEASAGLSHTPAGQDAAQGRIPPLQAPSYTLDQQTPSS